MLRYARLFAAFVIFSLSKSMQFRLDFFFRIVMDTAFYLVQLGSIILIYQHAGELGGWNQEQLLIFISIFFMIDGLYMTLFSGNIWMFPILVNKGDLDFYLMRPASPLFFLSLKDFSLSSFINFLMAVGIMIWATTHYQGSIAWWQWLLLLINIPVATILYYFLNLAFVLPVFWTHSYKAAITLFFSMGRFMERPDRIYFGVVRIVLVTVLPFLLITSYPARMFFEGFDVFVCVHFYGVTTLVIAAVYGAWRVGLRAYSSASS